MVKEIVKKKVLEEADKRMNQGEALEDIFAYCYEVGFNVGQSEAKKASIGLG